MSPAYLNTLVTREEARTIPCPDCAAKAGEKCVTHVGVEREGNHQGRVAAYRAQKTLKRRAA